MNRQKHAATLAAAALLAAPGCSWRDAEASGPFGRRPVASDVHACDTAAAHPSDLHRKAAGISEEKDIVPDLAIAACRQAIESFPSEPRFHFQLGRALLAANQFEAADKQFAIAAGGRYAAATHYLGEAALAVYWTSREAADGEKAYALFVEAAPEFAPAAERVERWTLRTEGLECPRVIRAIHEQSFVELQDARLLVAEYLLGMQEFFAQSLNPVGGYCPAILVKRGLEFSLEDAAAGNATGFAERYLYDGGIYAVSLFGKVLDPVWRGDVSRYRKFLRSLGFRDAQNLAERYGCESIVLTQVYEGIGQFAAARRPLKDYYKLVLQGSFKRLFSSDEPADAGSKTNPTEEGN